MVVPWRLIEGPESADAFVGEIAAAPIRRAARTSISGAIEFGADLFESSGYRGLRRVIDISGDGANNHGQLVTISRDDAVAKGITINGLPIMFEAAELRDHGYREARHLLRGLRDRRARRLRHPDRGAKTSSSRRPSTKLMLEIAGRVPAARIIPVSADKPRVSCTIGERLWQERWGN